MEKKVKQTSDCLPQQLLHIFAKKNMASSYGVNKNHRESERERKKITLSWFQIING